MALFIRTAGCRRFVPPVPVLLPGEGAVLAAVEVAVATVVESTRPLVLVWNGAATS